MNLAQRKTGGYINLHRNPKGIILILTLNFFNMYLKNCSFNMYLKNFYCFDKTIYPYQL